jgi:hypothetical protein
VIAKRKPVSEDSLAKHAADVALAGQFDDLLAQARAAEDALRSAQADGASAADLRLLGKRLDETLTAVMRAAFAAERAEIGPRGYEDRIYRRKAMATSPVRAWDDGGTAAAHAAREPPPGRHRPPSPGARRLTALPVPHRAAPASRTASPERPARAHQTSAVYNDPANCGVSARFLAFAGYKRPYDGSTRGKALRAPPG